MKTDFLLEFEIVSASFRSSLKPCYKTVKLFFVALLLSISSFAQPTTGVVNWIDQLNLSGGFPEKLLSTRSVVFHDYRLTAKEISSAQEYFQRTGIDAVSYFELDMLMSNKDVTKAFSDYLLKREIQNIIVIEKNETQYRVTITLFNGKENVIDAKQNAWSLSNSVLTEVLKTLYRTASNAKLKRENLLINDLAEHEVSINPITGKRNEFFAIDMKVDLLAVPKTGDETTDKKLEEIFKSVYPLKYKITEPGLTEKELRKQGCLYILCVIEARAIVAKDLLGYDMSKAASAIASMSYESGQPQVKNIPSNTVVYKVYFKHIDSGNVFLGTKWDADALFEQALMNQLKGLKAELKLN